MRKRSIFPVVALAAIFTMSSCFSSYKEKTVELSTLNDSLNYTLGLSNGGGIKSYYMQNDSIDNGLKAFISALDKAFQESKDENENDEIYQLGLNIGNSIKQQKDIGLMNDRTLALNVNLVKQGLINGLKQFQDSSMTAEDAQKYVDETMRKIQRAQIDAVSAIERISEQEQEGDK